METHYLKTWPTYFNAVKNGSKKFEIRLNDRDYRSGDILVLEEFIPCKKCEGSGSQLKLSMLLIGQKCEKQPCCSPPHGVYTGEKLTAKVTYTIGSEFGLVRDAIVMSIDLVQ